MSLLGVLLNNGTGTPGNDTDGKPYGWFPDGEQRDRKVQLAISVTFGISAFLTFCVLRPRWSELYNARKKQSKAAARLPELPKTMFGWIPVVHQITRAEILASAGLDAYAFLSFFQYAIKYLCITLFFSLTVILPVNNYYTGKCHGPVCIFPDNSTNSTAYTFEGYTLTYDKDDDKDKLVAPDKDFLWMYTVFAYFFTGVAIYLLINETKDMIRIRQAYLGTQSTVTDRTIRLSGIPLDMRSEEKITQFVEDLGIGKVDNIMLCRNWKKLDDTIARRGQCLRDLERSWAEYLGPRRSMALSRKRRRPIQDNGSTHADESQSLLPHETRDADEHDYRYLMHRRRPQHTLRFGFFGASSKKVDAIDYYEEKLRQYDSAVESLRKHEFEPTALAFVTMETAAACQMAVQAILDPLPGQFIANLAPPPADVVWSNTYLSRNHRMVRSWSIMIVIGFLSVFWAALLAPLAGLLRIESIDRVLPGFTDALEGHPIATSLIRSGFPTLVFSLLATGVPYLYDWLANKQGMTSQGDVELSVISKNFFFTFFNLFIVFTIWATGFTFLTFWEQLRDILKNTTTIAAIVAQSLQGLSPFYSNLIILQGFGLFPFRLLEVGTVSLYPIYLIGAKTPRDHAELVKPPIFSYGFYLPQTMLIFVICVVYSVWPSSWLIILFGLIYFIIGNFVYKYQLLYAMDHREHSTGQAWPMICNRIIMGLVIFHIALASYLSFQKALYQALLIGPLLIATVWFTVYFQRTYFPLMRFIALKSIDDRDGSPIMPTPAMSAFDRATDSGRAAEIDTTAGYHVRYMNPNLVSPLEELWIQGPGNEFQASEAEA